MKLFRDDVEDKIKPMLNDLEGITFRENPLDFFIMLARYKFPARLVDADDGVLDAGCGHGLGSVMLSRFAGCVTGADVDEDLIDYCRSAYRISNLDFAVADVTDLSGLDRQFDAIVCLDVIEHFSQEQGMIVVNSLAAALRRGGLLVMGTPNVRSAAFASERRRASHVFEYGPAEFRALLAGRFGRALVFSMTDEVVNTGFPELAWYLMGVCIK